MSNSRRCPRSIFVPFDPCDERRHAARLAAFHHNRDALIALLKLHKLRVEIRGQGLFVWAIQDPEVHLAPMRYGPRTGRVWIPGDKGCFRAHDPIQAVVLLEYGAKRLRWQCANGQLPCLARCDWTKVDRGPYRPPWSPQTYRRTRGRSRV